MKEEDKKIRIAGYARVSTGIQAEKGESLEMQEEEIKRYAQAHNYHLTKIYMDKGVSGAKESRPELDKLRKDAKEKKFQKVVFTKLSRFGRNTRNLLELFKEFEDEYNVGIVCIKENFDTATSSGRLLRTMLAAIAEFERDTIGTQMKEGKHARLKKNEIFIGEPPYGYIFNKEKKAMEVVEEEAHVYHDIVDMYLNQNISAKDIALFLNRRGIKSPKGTRWPVITVQYILKNPVYKGEYWGNQYEYDYSKKKTTINEEGKRVAIEKPEEDWVKFNFPPLIEEYRWDAVQRKVEFNKAKPKNERFPDLFWASGLIKCGVCGAKAGLRNGLTKNGKTPHHYMCYWRKASSKELELAGRERCSLPSVQMSNVDDHLWVRIVNLLTYPEKHLLQAIQEQSNLEELKKEKESIEAEVKSHERKSNKLFADLVKETEDNPLRDRLKVEIRALDKQVKEDQSRLKELNMQIGTITSDQEVLNGLKLEAFRKEVQKCLHDLPGKEKKQVIRILVSPENGGGVTLRPMVEGDRAVDDQVFREGKIKASDPVEGEVTADFDFKVQGEKITGAYEYLLNKGFLPDNIKNNGYQRICPAFRSPS